jgi:hypothetical protein
MAKSAFMVSFNVGRLNVHLRLSLCVCPNHSSLWLVCKKPALVVVPLQKGKFLSLNWNTCLWIIKRATVFWISVPRTVYHRVRLCLPQYNSSVDYRLALITCSTCKSLWKCMLVPNQNFETRTSYNNSCIFWEFVSQCHFRYYHLTSGDMCFSFYTFREFGFVEA